MSPSNIVRVHLKGGGYVRGIGDPGIVAHEVIGQALLRMSDPGDERAVYVPTDRVLYVEEEADTDD